MNPFPKMYAAGHVPQHIIELSRELVPRLLAGEHPALPALREQWARAELGDVELTGVGFFADIRVPEDAPVPAHTFDLTGGNAQISVAEVAHGAGCLLFVRGGRLSALEGFTYDGEWPDDAHVIAVEEVVPILGADAKSAG